MGDFYAWLLGWSILSKLHYRIFYLSGRALGLLNYRSVKVSGESKLLKRLFSTQVSPVIFDVGANQGTWIAEVLAACPGAELHAFEPQGQLAENLAARYPSMVVNSIGLSAEAGELVLYDYQNQEGTGHATLLKGVIDGVHQGLPGERGVVVNTLDAYCERKDICNIDLLKIDVEGFEFEVLKGGARMLAEGRVQAIQFEFNEMNVISRIFMRDFFLLLGPSFEFFRILPHGLLKLNPSKIWESEQFVFQNIIALKLKESPSGGG
jgi:FkbM family methyltransferase